MTFFLGDSLGNRLYFCQIIAYNLIKVCRVNLIRPICFYSQIEGICVRCRQSLAKTPKQVNLQDLGATGAVGDITEGLSDLTLVSF